MIKNNFKMPDSTPFVDGMFILEKFLGKGGWTFVRLPSIPLSTSNPFGWRKVCGSIDGVEFAQYKLMPMGDGSLFLPVKAAIRKHLRKEAGATVYVKLYDDHTPPAIIQELWDCLLLEPAAAEQFKRMSEQEQQQLADWIYSSKTEETKIQRIAEIISKLLVLHK